MKHKQKNKISISFCILLVFIVLLIISGTKIARYVLDSKDNEKIIENISSSIHIDENIKDDTNENKYTIDFETLKKTNSNTIGFLKVNGTDIEHIVVQANNNSYYLNHNFEKQENNAGWIFADYRNKFDGTDKNIIIYGHNMRNGTMFSSLKNILNEEWFNNQENRYITFITEKETSIYEIFSVYQVESEDYFIKTDFSNIEFENFINNLKQRSKFDFNVNVLLNDKILTLSTCANNNKYRVVLHARKL